MMWNFIWLVFTTLIAFFAYFWNNWRHLPPGPWGLPIVGYLPFLNPKTPYQTLNELTRKYGKIYGIQLGNIYSVVLADVKLIKKVFNNDAATGKPPLYLTNGIMQGYGIICAEGDLWKDQRKFVYNCLRMFGATKIGQNSQYLTNLLDDSALEFVHYLKQLNDESVTLDPHKPLAHSIGNIMNSLVFGKIYGRDDETWMWLQEMQDEGTKYIGVAGPLNFLPFLRFLPKFKQTMDYLINGKQNTHRLYEKIIKENIDLLNKEESLNNFVPTNVLQAFLIEREKRKGTPDYHKYYNDQQFYHMLADLFGAGLDTSLTTLRWYLLYIAVHRGIQSKIRNELNETLKDKPVTLNDLPSLNYLQASIAEIQRIRSVVPIGIPHGTFNNIQIDNYHIPKGTMIIPLQWAIHMDEEQWPNPEIYNPDRFLDDDGNFFTPDSFIPFQAGKRICIGKELGKMMVLIFGATIIQNFELTVPNNEIIDLTGECGITLTPPKHRLCFNKLLKM